MDDVSFFLGGYLCQGVGNLISAGVFAWFYRTYRRQYLVFLTLGWAILTVYQFTACLSMAVRMYGFGSENLRELISLASQITGYVSSWFFVLGAVRLQSDRPVPRWTWARVVPALIVTAVALTLLTRSSTTDTSLFVRVGLRSLFASAAFMFMAIWIARTTTLRGGFGRSASMIAAGLYSLALLHYFVIYTLPVFGYRDYTQAIFFVLPDLLLQTTMCLGMAVWLIEHERHRSSEQAAELERSQDQLRQSQKMEAIGQLAGGIAHDFNNILMGILGYSDLIEGEPTVEPQTKEYAREIRRAGSRAAGMTRQLLAFSRRQVIAPRVLDINSVAREMQDMLQRLIDSPVKFHADFSGQAMFVLLDRSQLEQIILNLVVNARDAMPNGGVLTVRTRAVDRETEDATSKPFACLEIADTGVGMNAVTVDHVFEPFFTTKGRENGTGLGLSTVYGIVYQNSGTISIDSEPGEGTTVKIYLPLTSSQPDEDPPSELRIPSGSTARILVVEDEQQVRDLVVHALQRAGYEVSSAKDGDAADQIAGRSKPFDLLITDLVMPGRDGVQVAVDLRKTQPNLQILVMSGYAEPPTLKEVRTRLRADFIPKPFTPTTLIRRVESLLGDETPDKVTSPARTPEG